MIPNSRNSHVVLSHLVIIDALCNKIVPLSNKKAVTLFNNRPSHFIITLDTLCNKFEMDGWRTVNPNNKASSSTAQDKSRITVSPEQYSGFIEICNVRQPGWALRAYY